jgi:EAL domain-containing protein (putative c-di-GMP-specific phosphodiesterase class I)/FixJ family two-component response regulator
MTGTPDGRSGISTDDANGRPRGALCFVVDDEAAIARFITIALGSYGVESREFNTAATMLNGLAGGTPKLIFLDISLGDSDAIDAIRGLAERGFAGAIQLMSGRDTVLLEDVKRIGERHGLRMLPVLTKPFRLDAVRRVVDNERLMPAEDDLAESVVAEVNPQTVAARPPDVDLEEALRKNWLELWYQPKLDLRRKRLVGAEGLARIRHPEHGIVMPGSFIPRASEAALIVLAERALHTALRDTREFAEAGFELQLAINVPVEALLKLPIPTIVRDQRSNTEDWAGIVLEVTEDQVIRDIATVHEIATQLRIYRVSLAIDDFGRGYSSLARLKELPFAELKLDQSFVADCGIDPTNAALCKTAVELAHRFGSIAVAEGIETSTDLVAIARTGCDVAQGFLFAHAMPKEFLLTRLRADGMDASFAAPIAAIGDILSVGPGGRFRASA